MLSLNMTAANWSTYLAHLNASYEMKTVVQITDLDHKVVSDVSHLLVEGDVEAEEVDGGDDEGGDDGSSDTAVQASCSLTLCDPARSLGLDSRSPAEAAIYLDRMIKVVVSVHHPVLGWIDCPVFIGPITKFERDGVTASIEAQSKERLLLGQADKTDKYTGGKIAAIKAIATEFGESSSRVDLPPLKGNLPEKVTFTRDTLPWTRIWHVARTLSHTAFYDARGVLRLAPETSAVVLTMRGDAVSTSVQVGYDTDDLRNGVRVIGKKSSIDRTEYLSESNPNSRQRLGRRGKLRSIVEKIEDSDIRSTKEATKVAERELAKRGATIVRPTFDCNPVWPLEIGDHVQLYLDEYVGVARVTSWRKPLTCDDQMTFGYTRPVLKPSSSIRRP